MRDVAIIGKSPHLNKVDVNSIIDKMDTIAINHVQELYPCNYVWCNDLGRIDDFNIEKFKPFEKLFSLLTPQAIEYVKTRNINAQLFKPIENRIIEDNTGIGLCRFTLSSALNWAYLQGYTNIYLVGITHELDGAMSYYNGLEYQVHPLMNKELREYVYKYKDLINIYQTDPEHNWDLHYRRI